MPLSILENIDHSPRGLSQKHFKYVREFKGLINQRIIPRLNFLIHACNAEKDKAKKLELLQEIAIFVEQTNNKAPGNLAQHCPSFHEQLNVRLYSELRQERALLQEIPPSDLPPDVLANMSPEDLKSLAIALEKEDSAKINLCFGGRGYILRRLGGINSKNYGLKVRGVSGEYVLKLDGRLGFPRHVEVYLRARGFSGIFAPVYANRPVTYPDVSHMQTKHVMMTKLYGGGDLETHAQKPAPFYDVFGSQHVNCAIDIYTQMAEILGAMQANGCIFPDMKNSNWLIDEAGNLKISDTKSLLFTDSQGKLDKTDAEQSNWNCGRVANTTYMNPPELWGNKPSADKLHAYMLGKNLYQYLVRCSWRALNTPQLNFNLPVFQGPRGEALKVLIQDLLNRDPKARPSITDARDRLKKIGNSTPRETSSLFEHFTACAEILKKIAAPFDGSSDEKLNHFIDDMRLQVAQAKTPAERKLIQERLERIFQTLCVFEKEHPVDSHAFLVRRNMLFHIAVHATEDVDKLITAFPESFNFCMSILDEIESCQVTVRGVKDKEMLRFINSTFERLKAVKTPDELAGLKQELYQTLDSVTESYALVQEIEALSKACRDAKGMQIAQALREVPLDERGKLVQGGTEKTDAVLKALASQQYFRSFSKTRHEGSLNPNEAHSMFNEFKKRHQAELPHDKKEVGSNLRPKNQ